MLYLGHRCYKTPSPAQPLQPIPEGSHCLFQPASRAYNCGCLAMAKESQQASRMVSKPFVYYCDTFIWCCLVHASMHTRDVAEDNAYANTIAGMVFVQAKADNLVVANNPSQFACGCFGKGIFYHCVNMHRYNIIVLLGLNNTSQVSYLLQPSCSCCGLVL